MREGLALQRKSLYIDIIISVIFAAPAAYLSEIKGIELYASVVGRVNYSESARLGRKLCS